MISSSLYIVSEQAVQGIASTFQSLYNTPCFYMESDIIWSCYSSQFFYHVILQNNYKRMTMKWSFPYNSFVKLSIYKMIYLKQVHFYRPQIIQSIIKRLHYT